MSRPAAIVYLRRIVDADETVEELVVAAQADQLYAVLFRGIPINLLRRRLDRHDGVAKYRRTAFSNWGHANRLMLALNRLYHTDEFTVSALKP